MKICKYDWKKNKWFKKLDWTRLITVFILVLLLSFLILNYLGLEKNVENALFTSLFITLLITLELVLIDLVDDKDRVFILDNKKISYIEIHNKKDGKYLSDLEYREILKKSKPEDILNKQEKYEGIDCGEVLNVYKISKRMNRIVVKMEVLEKEWYSPNKFTISELKIKENKYNKKIVVSKSYSNFDTLLKALNEKLNK